MLGIHDPSSQSSRNRGKRLTGRDQQCLPDRSNVPPQTFDWRDFGMVTSVKNQGVCGDDWAFAATAAIESALLVRHKTLRTNITLNLSEQQLIDCAKEDACNGGDAR